MPFRVGLSGYASPSVRDALRATPTCSSLDLLEEYARHFDALETDSTFVRFPSQATIESWTARLPTDFYVSVRVSREFTHVRRLEDLGLMHEELQALAPLGDRLRCLHFATHPSMACDASKVRNVLDLVPPSIATAWEFHSASWDCPEVSDLLTEHGSAQVVVDTRHDEIADVPFVYLRLRRDHYTADDVVQWGETLALQHVPIRAFFKPSSEAPYYARALAEELSAHVNTATNDTRISR